MDRATHRFSHERTWQDAVSSIQFRSEAVRQNSRSEVTGLSVRPFEAPTLMALRFCLREFGYNDEFRG